MKCMSSSTSRRQFLGHTASIGAGFGSLVSLSPTLRADESALQGLSAACVGVGGKGSSDTSHIAEQGVNIVIAWMLMSERSIKNHVSFLMQKKNSVILVKCWTSLEIRLTL